MADLKTALAECVRLHGKANLGVCDVFADEDAAAITALHNLLHDHGDELLAAVRDARRMAWLRDNWARIHTVTGCTATEVVVTELFVAADHRPVAPWSLDAAIDAAIGAGE